MKNKNFKNREHVANVYGATAAKRGIWRKASVCLLFAAIVFSSVFGITGLFGSRSGASDFSPVAYADNAALQQKWIQAVADGTDPENPSVFKLDSDWIAEVKEADRTDNYANSCKRTEFGVDPTAFIYNRDTRYDPVRSDTSGALLVPADRYVVLDLNGHKLDRNLIDGLGQAMNANGFVIRVDGYLKITDTSAKKEGVITGGWNASNTVGTWGGAINVNTAKGKVEMDAGTITGNLHYAGGAVAINTGNPSTGFIMSGTAKISGNDCYGYYNDYRSAGGVHNYNGLFEMHDNSSISDNTGLIGGFSCYSGAKSYMYDDAKIDHNRSYASYAQMQADTAKDGSTNTSTATYSVGGVHIHTSNVFEMHGKSSISNNTGLIGGVSTYYYNTFAMMDDSSVTENTSTSADTTKSTGGVGTEGYSTYWNTMTMSDNATVSKNKGMVGGVNNWNSSGSLAINMFGNASIKENESVKVGTDMRAAGGVHVSNGVTLSMNDDSTISGNIAGWDKANGTRFKWGTGGVIYYGTVVLNDRASIKGNIGLGTERGAGGAGSWDRYGALYMRGGEISGNYGYISGGVYKGSDMNYYQSYMSVAYAAKVENNWVVEDIADANEDSTNKSPSDVDLHCGRIYGAAQDFRPTTYMRNNVITVEAGLEDGAHIGVIKYTNNYTTDVSAVFTKNYYINNATENPGDFFFSSLKDSANKPLFDVTIRIPNNGYAEAGFESYADIQNWQYAVSASSTTNPLTVKLYHDITARDVCGTTWNQFYGEYQDGYAFTSGALHVPSGKSIILDLNGHTIDRKMANAEQGGYVINNAGVLEITDTSGKTGKITGGNNKTNDARYNYSGGGGGIYNSGTLTISGGSIEGNEAILGGGIYVASGKLFVKGGYVKDNAANTSEFASLDKNSGMGGGIYAVNPGEVTISGGTISGNSAVYGGGVYLFASDTTNAKTVKLKIWGGTITKNVSSRTAGGVGIHQLNTYFGMKGAPVIKDNTCNGNPNDIHLPSAVLNGPVNFGNGIITVEAELTGDEDNTYGVYRDIGYTLTKNFSTYNKEKAPADVFVAQKDSFYIATSEDGKEAELISEHGYHNWYSAVVLSRIEGNKSYTVKLTEDWTAVKNTAANFNTSLYGDRTVDTDTSGSGAYFYGALCVPASTSIVLDLNGFTINRGLTKGYAGSLWGMAVAIYGGSLTIQDTSEDGEGKITGGWMQNEGNAYYGGGITLLNDASRLTMLGGNITENKSTGYYNGSVPKGVGGVALTTENSQFTMLGGSITNNIGTFAGGVGFHTLKAGTFNIGGKVVIEGNCLGNALTAFGKGTPNDVHNPGDTAGTTLAHSLDQNRYKIGVAGTFEEGARIGISRPEVNNTVFNDTNGNVFTSGYSMFNTNEDGSVVDPKTYFFPSIKSQSEIRSYEISGGAGAEAAVWNVDPSTNWSAAHAKAQGVNSAPIVVTLQCDWIADANGKMYDSKNYPTPPSGFSAEGGLAMSQSNIILDLNGYTIDRGLTYGAIENGYVIYMSGTCRLEITDSSEEKTGKIIGGNNLTAGQAGGINVASATAYLTLNGGTITGNKGDAGGVATHTNAAFQEVNYFAMGGSALVTGNVNIEEEPLNINLRGKYNQQIQILSTLTAEGQSGVTKDSSSDFTVNFPAYHEDNPPTDYFVNDSESNYVIKASSGEGALYTMDNYSNWVFAVNESKATGGERTVMLVSDWIAPMTTGMFGKSASDNVAFFSGGGLNVPGGAKIVLDLNGYTLNRNLKVATDYGFVINVENGGQLTVRDTYVAGEDGEKRVGTITGGYNRSTASDYAGGGINNRYKLYIEGGVITGNYSTADVSYSSGGVFNDSHAGVAMYMTGGTITGNYGAFTGGANVHTATNVYVGGSAVVRNNRLVGGKLSDIRPYGDAIGYRINIYSAFTEDAYVGVSYIANNYNADRNSRIFTNNFTTVNAGVDPSTVFHYADPMTYRVISLAPTASSTAYEAAVECIDSVQNWQQAIEASSATVKHTVTLYRDWIAADDNTNITSFGVATSAYINGALRVPSGRSVVLDLNGFTLDRNLTAARTQGLVILVDGGNLEITDSSAAKTGKVTGGYSNDTAGAIHFTSGSLTLTGGAISGNTGTIGGVYILNTAALPFAMGGSAVVADNTDVKFNPSNVVSTSPIQMIDIVSPITSKVKTCFERPGVGEFTTNFASKMSGKDPADYFTSVDPMYVFKSDVGEGSIYTNDNATNWEYAIKSSISGGKKQITFMLVDDWLAVGGVFGKTYNQAFVMDVGEGNGALFVPNTADIVFDLNGHVLDRGLISAVSEGYVFRVFGNLKIIDTSKEGTGVITGGNNNYNGATYCAQSSFIYMYDGGRVTIEGGTITGNTANGTYSSAITLGRDNRYIGLTITGGTITGNYGGSTAAGNDEGAGAILTMAPSVLRLAGNPKIENNMHNGGYECNVRLQRADYYIEVVGEFVNGAHIGVAPTSQVDNWASSTVIGAQFTTGYSTHNKGATNYPSRYFFGKWVRDHEVRYTNTNNGIEGSLYCMENYVNWANAVYHSGTTTPITFQLTKDWTATADSQFGSMFSPTDRSTNFGSYYNYGAICLPYNRYVILDLNGYTIDRNLQTAVVNGYAICSRGHLEIIDTSKGKTGKIKGGYNNAGGGGVFTDGANVGNYASNGLLRIEGGTITDNVGTAGAGVYVNGSAQLHLGGYVQIYGNYSVTGEASNVFVENTTVGNKCSMINVVSAFTGSKTTRQKIGVSRGSNGDVTVGFADNMPGDSPLDYFVSENAKYYGIESGNGEFFFLSPNNDINWEYAVTQSMGNKPAQTVRLAEDWIAGDNPTNQTAFYTAAPSSNGVWNGALYVPAGATVILDLNGYTVDRNLKSAQRYGLVIVVMGKLTVIDTSEEGTGVITGGHIPDNYEDTYSLSGGVMVGWSNCKARFDLLGGTISGNYYDRTGNFAGGVYVYSGSTFNIEDATVTDNHSPKSGVFVANGAIMSASGKAVIEGNGPTGSDIERDVVFGNNEGGVINVVGAFEEGAHIGVYKQVNNYHSLTFGGAKITTDYSRYNSKPVETYFFSSDAPIYDIIELSGTGSKEVGLFCFDNTINWYNAVHYSSAQTGEATVKLYSDWDAGTSTSNSTPYFNYVTVDNGGWTGIYNGAPDNAAFYQGAIRVGSGRQVLLDLNGYKIDRKLTSANQYGYVIFVQGSLRIIDTSKGGTGMITGGWTDGKTLNDINNAAGVHVTGTFSMEGGMITGNKGIGLYFTGNTPFSLGGKARVTGNVFDKGDEVNIFMADKNQKIKIISKFEDGAQFGVARAKGTNVFGNGQLTENYSKYNKKTEPTEFFTSDNKDYDVVNEGFLEDESMEAVIMGKNNQDNWAYAVQTSKANGGRAQTFTMSGDWTADAVNNGNTTEFNNGKSLTGYCYGALYVPYGVSVILDLNGYTLNRNLKNPQANGEVIYVRGTLTIRDSSEKQTGKITGANTNDSSSNMWESGVGYLYGQSYGAVSVYLGTLNMEGGAITGNKNAGTVAGGVYLSSGATFTMTGGKITGNSCYNPNNGTTVRGIGGVYADGNVALGIGGGYIYDNRYQDSAGTVLGDTQSNLYLQNATNQIMVTGYFEKESKIGVTVNSNQIAASGRFITSGWQTLNNDNDASKTFVTDHNDQYMIQDYQQDGKHEAIMFCRDNQVNWMNTVQTSINTGKTQTFVLYEDWKADPISASWASSSFYAPSSNATGYYYGALFVPGNASIILDLNGHTIDRDLWKNTGYSSYGYVIIVNGSLTIIDSTAKTDRNGNIVQGKITGGYGYDGGGIYANYGKLDVQAGLICNNRVARYGAGIFIYQGAVSLGGTVQFYNNVHQGTDGASEDLMFWYSNHTLNISAPFVTGSDKEYNNITVQRNSIGTFTTNWGKHNPTTKPESRFVAELADYRVYSSGTGSQREGVMLKNNNNENWIFAVTTSLATKSPERFTLVDEGGKGGWIAPDYNVTSYKTSFGSHSQAYRNGALYVPAGANVVLDLNGLTLDRNHSSQTDAQYATYNMVILVEGTLQIIDSSASAKGKITGGSYGVFINSKTATVTFGGIPLGDDSLLTGDEANVYGSASGGAITGNTKSGVYVNYGTFTATGGSLVGNSESGVYVTKNADTTIRIADSPIFFTDKTTKNPGIIMLDPEEVIQIIAPLADEARIGYMRQGVGQLTKGWGENQGDATDPFKAIFISQDPAEYNPTTATFDGHTEITVSSYDSVVNWQATVDKSIATGKQQEFVMYACWNAKENTDYTTAFGTTSAYKNGALYVPAGANVVLNLNGHVLDRKLTKAVGNGMVIYVDGELTIKSEQLTDPASLVVNCCTKDKDGNRPVGRITGGNNNTGSSSAGLFVGKDGSVVFESGRFNENIVKTDSASATSSAGAVYVAGKFEMSGGQIDGNEGTSAGAVYVASSGTFVMSDGTISNNEGSNCGGIYTTGTFDFCGGKITENEGGIGAVYVGSGGKFTMEQSEDGADAEITSNTGVSAGAVYVNNGLNTYFVMKSGYITDNTGVSAGAIYAAGKVEIRGGYVRDNTATGAKSGGNEGAGAIFIANTGNVTVNGDVSANSFVDISNNVGVNGIRVHSSGILGVGGDVRIYENKAAVKNLSGDDDIGENDYNNIYFVTSTRKLEVVAAFASEATIGIYRFNTGVFTKGYGLYNSAHPEDYFVSDISIYQIAFSEQDNVLENEAAIGMIVSPAPKALTKENEDANVYNGQYQTIIENIDLTKVAFDEDDFPEGVRATEPDGDGLVSIEAVHAGDYMITFTVKNGFCWSDGTTSERGITGEIAQKQVKLVWTDCEESSGQCNYTGSSHAPTAAADPDSLVTNVLNDNKKDTCTINQNNGQKNSGTYTATAASANPDYFVAEDDVKEFTIGKALRANLAITTTQAAYQTPTQIAYERYEEDGEPSYKVISGDAEFVDGMLVISAKPGEKVKIELTLGESKNFAAKTVETEIECVRATLGKDTALAFTEMVYGEVKTLAIAEAYDGMNDELGSIKWTTETKYDGTNGLAMINQSVLTATHVGKIRVTATIEASDYFEAATIVGVIEIVPKQITLDWGEALSVVYNGSAQTVETPKALDENGDEINDTTYTCIDGVYKAGFAGWDGTGKQAPTWTNAGKYDIGVILGDNYCLADSDEYFATFEITKATPNAKFTEIDVYYNMTVTPAVEYIDGFGDPDAKVIIEVHKSNTEVNYKTGADADGNQTWTVTSKGKFALMATIAETDNFAETTIYVVYDVNEAEMNLGVRASSTPDGKLYYGDDGEIIVAYYLDANKNSIDLAYSEATIALVEGYEDYATVTSNDDLSRVLITVHKAGTIKLKVTALVDKDNYKATSNEVELELLPKSLGVDWTGYDESEGYIYNGLAQHPDAAAKTNGLIGGDEVTVTGYKAFVKVDGGYEELEEGAVHVGTYYIVPVFDDGNYAVYMDNAIEIEIKPLPVALAWTDTLLTYNGKSQAPTAEVVNRKYDDKITVTVLGTKEASGVDTYITAKAYELDNDDYTLEGGADLTCEFRILQFEIEIEWGETALTYNGLAQHPDYTIKGLFEGDTCEAIISGAEINSGTGYVASVVGLDNPNYKAPEGEGVEFSISSAELDVTFKRTTAVYGTPFVLELEGNAGNGKVTYSIKTGGDKATVGTGNLFTPTGVGEVTVTASIAATNNYEALEIEQVITISPRPIEVSWGDLEFEYDGDTHNPVATVVNAINGDDITLVLSDPVKHADTYTAKVIGILNADGETEEKYTVTDGLYTEQEFVITPRVLDISWTNVTLTYTGEELAPTPVLNNLIEGDACGLTVSGQVNAGNRLIAEITEVDNPDYTVSEDDLTTRFNISPKLVTIEWGETVLTYNGSVQHPSATALGLVEGDECEINVSGGEVNVGEDYKATATGVKNSNYTLVYDEETTPEDRRPVTEKSFSIIKADIEIALAETEVLYGSTLNLTLNNNPGNAEVTFELKDNAANTGAVEIPKDDDGNDKSELLATKAGKVILTVTVADSKNYNGASIEIEITVKQLPVEIDWEYAEYIYNGDEQKPTPTVTNALEGDTVNITSVSGSKDAGNNLVAEVLALDNDNYTLEGGTNVTAVYAILPKPVESIEWDEDRVYAFNGKDQGPNATAGGLIEGDECAVEVSGWKTNVGKYTATVTGLKNSNYSLELISDLTAEFEIVVSDPEITFATKQVILGTWEQIVIDGNVGGGEVSFELLEGEDYGELSGDMLYGKALGSVKVKVTVSATSNTTAAEAEGVISISKGAAPLSLVTTTTTYGEQLILTPDDDYGKLLGENGEFLFGEVTYYIENRYSPLAEIGVDDDGNAVLIAKGVGDLKLHMSVGDTDYYDATEVIIDITIIPRIVKIKWSGDTFGYDGQEHAPTATVTNLVNGDECEITVAGEINAGDYTAEALALSNDKYTLERAKNTTKDYTIEKATLTLTWGDDVLRFNGGERIPEATLDGIVGADEVNPVFVIADGKSPVNKGTYTVTVSELEGEAAGNYVLDKEYELVFEIIAADREPVLDPAEVAYGASVTLVITDESLIEASGYTLTVLKNESVGAGTLSLKDGVYVFEATRVGKVKISVEIDPSANCNGYTGTIDVLVVKAERETTITSTTAVYGEELLLTLDGYDGDMSEVKFTLAKEDRANAEIVWNADEGAWYLVPKHAAFVTVSVTVPETTNHVDEEPSSAVIEIKQRVAVLRWDNTGLTYNGEEQAPTAVVANLVNGDTCGVVIGSGNVNAGHYEVFANSLTNDDYTLTGNRVTIYTLYNIDKAPIEVQLKNTRVGADAPTTLVVTGNDGNAAVSFTVDDTNMATVEGDVFTPKQKGTVYVTIHVEESANYLGFTSQPILVVIDKSPLSLALIEDEVLYGEELELEVSGNVENTQVKYTCTNATGEAYIVSGNILVAQAAGEVIVTVTVPATEKYALTIETFTVTINQRVVEISWSDKNEFHFDGVNLWAPTARVVSGLINDDECDVIVEGGQLNVGRYAAGTAKAVGLTNSNYKLEGDLRAPQFEIKKAALQLEFLTTFVTIGVPTEIKISGNKEFGATTFILDIAATQTEPVGDATLEGATLTGTKLGFVHVTVTVAPTDNYDGGFAELDIEVQKPAAPVDLEVKEVEYGSKLILAIDKGLKELEDGSFVSADEGGEYSLSLVADKGTGSATLEGNELTATGAGFVYVMITVTETETYKLTQKEIKVTITPIVIEVEWTYPEFVYNGTEQTPTATVTNAINGDTFTLEYSGSVDAGKNLLAEITATGNPNYTIVGADVTTRYEIKPLAVNLSWDDSEIFTYNGKEQKPTATVTNAIEGDEPEVRVQGAVNAGTQTATAISVDDPNYTVEDGVNVTFLFLINKLSVEVEWGELELPYNGKVQVPDATAVGAVAGDEVHAVVTGTGKYIGTYSARATTVDNANYTLKTQIVESYTIVPAKVTFSQLTIEKEYSGEDQSPDVAINKLDPADTVDIMVLDYVPDKEVGEYPFRLGITGAQAGNYYIADEDKTMIFSIVAKSVSIILSTKDISAEYTGSAITLGSWYDLACEGFIGADASKSVREIFPIIDIDVAYKFLFNGETVDVAGIRGVYTILAQEPTSYVFSGTDNYKVTEIILVNEGILTVSGGDALKLAEDSTFAFQYLRVEQDEDDIYYYRDTYDAHNYVHGKDDTNFNKVILGNIKAYTSVNDFINGLDATQLNKIRIYNKDNELIFDCGHAAEGIDEMDLYDPDSYAVGTGWRVVYGLDEDMADVVYVSVLGDIDGDGYVMSEDMSSISRYIMDLEEFNEEMMFAALIENFGFISAEDISIIGRVIREEELIEDHF